MVLLQSIIMFRMLNNIKPKACCVGRHIALLSNSIYQMVDCVPSRIFYQYQPSQLLTCSDLLR